MFAIVYKMEYILICSFIIATKEWFVLCIDYCI